MNSTLFVSIVIAVVTSLVQCICVSILVYHLWRFYVHAFHRQEAVLKRHPSITIVAVIIGILSICNHTLYIWSILFSGNVSRILLILFQVLNTIWTFSFSYAILSRVWLAYFDIQYHFSRSQQSWQNYIHEKALKQDWFMLNKNTYGNTRFVIVRTIIVVIISLILVFLLYVIIIYIIYTLIYIVNTLCVLNFYVECVHGFILFGFLESTH